MIGRLGWGSFLLVWLFLCVVPAGAQTSDSAILFPPDMDAFPRVNIFVDVHDSRGEFIHGLRTDELRLLENGKALPALELSELRPGVQVVFVLNPGNSFGIRNSQGTSRYDFVADSLRNWAHSRQGSNIDDLSLLVSTGVERSHFTDPLTIVSALESFQLDISSIPPGLEVLNRAVDIAADQVPRPGMKRAVLFITSPLEGDITFGLQDLVARASQENVHIFIWLVASPQILESSATNLLSQLAQQTGGELFAFSGEELLPNPESYLRSRRDIYHLVYESQIATGGVQQLELEILHDDQVITSPVLAFDFDLRPPNPAFISPLVEIQRALPADPARKLTQEVNPDELSPRVQDLQILLEFPDGRPRALVRTALYVDDNLVAENTQPPFDRFTWDLSQYLESGQHILQVEAQDNLGLAGKSVQLPVEILVVLPQLNPLNLLLRYWPALLGFTVVLALAAWLLVLIMRGRIRPRVLSMAKGLRRGGRWLSGVSNVTKVFSDTRSVSRRRSQRSSSWVNRLNWPQRRLVTKADAYLMPLNESEERFQSTPISITRDELTIGRDPERAIIAINDPSLDRLHTRLVKNPEGSFLIVDQGSVAGTWVNYAQVSPEGAVLEDGDLVHIGRLGFRFSEHTPKRVRKVSVQEWTEP
ncbi:MAG TPA: FHA domain-containing protein [Anaerolineales bacterium]|nr:FHA domain-containing protein [Anaerolineales bacterium]